MCVFGGGWGLKLCFLNALKMFQEAAVVISQNTEGLLRWGWGR